LKFKNLFTCHSFLFFFLLAGYLQSIYAQEISGKIDVIKEYQSLDKDINSALTNQVDVLSPRNFKIARTYTDDAKKNIDKLTLLQKDIQRQLTKARDYLNNASEAAKISHTHIEEVVTARQQAVTAGAPIFFLYDFQKADDLLRKVTSDLEINNTENSYQNSTLLQRTYSNLELRSIKHQNLAAARLTLIQAIKDGAKNYVPEKLKKALRDYKETLAYINDHRHDVAQIETRSREVNESANQILQSTHDLATSTVTLTEDEKLEDQIQTQQSAVASEQKTIRSLKDKIQALEAEKAINDKLEQARNQFATNEAEIYKLGNTVIIRLRGLKFPASETLLNDSSLKLLGKVRRIVKDFANSSVVVEGHTDSVGSKVLNDKISRMRAEKVKNYLLSVDAVPANKIIAVGRAGEAPLASNNTPEGRAQNRRADILIKL